MNSSKSKAKQPRQSKQAKTKKPLKEIEEDFLIELEEKLSAEQQIGHKLKRMEQSNSEPEGFIPSDEEVQLYPESQGKSKMFAMLDDNDILMEANQDKKLTAKEKKAMKNDPNNMSIKSFVKDTPEANHHQEPSPIKTTAKKSSASKPMAKMSLEELEKLKQSLQAETLLSCDQPKQLRFQMDSQSEEVIHKQNTVPQKDFFGAFQTTNMQLQNQTPLPVQKNPSLNLPSLDQLSAISVSILGKFTSLNETELIQRLSSLKIPFCLNANPSYTHMFVGDYLMDKFKRKSKAAPQQSSEYILALKANVKMVTSSQINHFLSAVEERKNKISPNLQVDMPLTINQPKQSTKTIVTAKNNTADFQVKLNPQLTNSKPDSVRSHKNITSQKPSTPSWQISVNLPKQQQKTTHSVYKPMLSQNVTQKAQKSDILKQRAKQVLKKSQTTEDLPNTNARNRFHSSQPEPPYQSQVPLKKVVNTHLPPRNFIQSPKPATSSSWAVKYAPTSLEGIIGQYDKVNKLKSWLKNWTADEGLSKGNKNFKAALISGEAGIGKTTTVRLLAANMGYQLIELNASDIRNKGSVSLVNSTSYTIGQSFNGKESKLIKPLVLFDEVDGMSSGDRGGISEIINTIKNTKVPIVCACNDRGSDKIRSLANHCLDVRYQKCNPKDIVNWLQRIIAKEGFTPPNQLQFLQNLVQMLQRDIRAILNNLQFMAFTKALPTAKDTLNNINPFDACKILCNEMQAAKLSVSQKIDVYFNDNSLVPLLIQENYLACSAKYDKRTVPKRAFILARAAESIADSDVIDCYIRRTQDYSLSVAHAVLSTISPTQLVCNTLGFPMFPAALGKGSTIRKQRRLLVELKQMFAAAGFKHGIEAVKDIVGILLKELINLLQSSRFDEALNLLDTYHIEAPMVASHLVPLTPNGKTLFEKVSPAAKKKLTVLFNTKHIGVKSKTAKEKGLNQKNSKAIKKSMSEISAEEDKPDAQSEEQAENESDSQMLML